MRHIALYCICIVTLLFSGCTLAQMYTAVSDKFSSSSSGSGTNTAAQVKSKPELNSFEAKEEYYNKRRDPSLSSYPIGPSVFGFQLGQSYIDALKNAENLERKYGVKYRLTMSNIIEMPGLTFQDRLTARTKPVKDIRYADFIHIYADDEKGTGHFYVVLNDIGKIKKIFIDKYGLSIFHTRFSNFIDAFNHAAKTNVQCSTVNNFSIYGIFLGSEYVCQAQGDQWKISGHIDNLTLE